MCRGALKDSLRGAALPFPLPSELALEIPVSENVGGYGCSDHGQGREADCDDVDPHPPEKYGSGAERGPIYGYFSCEDVEKKKRVRASAWRERAGGSGLADRGPHGSHEHGGSVRVQRAAERIRVPRGPPRRFGGVLHRLRRGALDDGELGLVDRHGVAGIRRGNLSGGPCVPGGQPRRDGLPLLGAGPVRDPDIAEAPV